MAGLLALIRPHQYIKNLFIFMPLFFAGEITDQNLFLSALTAFFAFSVTASAIYIFNDFLDVEQDRQHPDKRRRPLASGIVQKRTAAIFMIILGVAGTSLMAKVSFQAFAALGAYVVLNIAYSIRLKHVALLDVTIIATGFVIRLLVGSLVTGTPLSMWIVIMTFLLALFIALAKRRDDAMLFLDTGLKTRKVIDGYNLQLIDSAMMIMASVVIVAYVMYTTSPEVVARLQSEYLYLTGVFVILGIMRYMQIAFVENRSGSPTQIVINDRFLQLDVSAWALSFVWLLYL